MEREQVAGLTIELFFYDLANLFRAFDLPFFQKKALMCSTTYGDFGILCVMVMEPILKSLN